MTPAFAIEFTARDSEDASFRVSTRGHHSIRGITLAGGTRRTETWSLPADGRYQFLVRGPRGLVREYRGSLEQVGGQMFEAQIAFDDGTEPRPALRIANFGTLGGVVIVKDLDAREETRLEIAGDDVVEWRPRRHACRYNYCVTSVDQPELRWHFAGSDEASMPRRERAVGVSAAASR